jgi:hypothetical protein
VFSAADKPRYTGGAEMSVHHIGLRPWSSVVLGSLVTILGSASIAAGEPGHHVLDFSGKGAAFVVKEPPGWFADTTIAHQFGADVIFYPAAGDPHSTLTPVIRVVVIKKTGEGTRSDLNDYVEHYRARFQDVEFRDSATRHPRYRAYAKLVCAPGKFCDYVTFLDPGPGSAFMLSVTLNRPKRAATSTELAAYKHVVASLDRDQVQ